jgi:hypothetical protein
MNDTGRKSSYKQNDRDQQHPDMSVIAFSLPEFSVFLIDIF